MKKATYFVEGYEVSHSECLEYFILYSGYNKDDAIYEFNCNNNEESCNYINEMCSDVEVIYEEVEVYDEFGVNTQNTFNTKELS